MVDMNNNTIKFERITEYIKATNLEDNLNEVNIVSSNPSNTIILNNSINISFTELESFFKTKNSVTPFNNKIQSQLNTDTQLLKELIYIVNEYSKKENNDSTSKQRLLFLFLIYIHNLSTDTENKVKASFYDILFKEGYYNQLFSSVVFENIISNKVKKVILGIIYTLFFTSKTNFSSLTGFQFNFLFDILSCINLTSGEKTRDTEDITDWINIIITFIINNEEDVSHMNIEINKYSEEGFSDEFNNTSNNSNKRVYLIERVFKTLSEINKLVFLELIRDIYENKKDCNELIIRESSALFIFKLLIYSLKQNKKLLSITKISELNKEFNVNYSINENENENERIILDLEVFSYNDLSYYERSHHLSDSNTETNKLQNNFKLEKSFNYILLLSDILAIIITYQPFLVKFQENNNSFSEETNSEDYSYDLINKAYNPSFNSIIDLHKKETVLFVVKTIISLLQISDDYYEKYFNRRKALKQKDIIDKSINKEDIDKNLNLPYQDTSVDFDTKLPLDNEFNKSDCTNNVNSTIKENFIKEKSVLYTYQSNLVKIVSNYSYKNKQMAMIFANKIEEYLYIMNHMKIDRCNPFKKEWAVLLVKSLSEQSYALQKAVDQLKPFDIDPMTREFLNKKGYNIKIDNGFSKPTITKNSN